jgi:ATP-dependent DNA helicase RecG
LRDEDLIERAREVATRLVSDDPELKNAPQLAAEVALLMEEEKASFVDKG